MSDLFAVPYFGVLLTVVAYWVATKIQRKTGHVLCNNMLLGALFVIIVLKVFPRPLIAAAVLSLR